MQSLNAVHLHMLTLDACSLAAPGLDVLALILKKAALLDVS